MKRVSQSLIVWIMVATLALAQDQAASRPPNIVLIVADDLGYGEVGCFGQTRIQTPHIDALARQGLRLTHHYSGNAVCAPSRCVLMTGKHPGHAWIRNNSEAQPEGQGPMAAAEVTIAELLKRQGYVTGAFGKWGLGAPDSEGEPLRQGFDRFYGYNCQRVAHSYYPEYLWSNRQKVFLNNKPPIPGHAKLKDDDDDSDAQSYDQFKGQDYAPDRIHEEALDFIRSHASQPFFLYYPTIIPHLALHVPDQALQPYVELNWDDPPFTKRKGGGYTPHFTPRAAYAAMISRMDQYVGNVTQLLDELGIADNTLVIFSSDNGTTHLHREVDAKFFNSTGELRGYKGSLHEGGLRVPTVVKWPGHTPAGTSCEFVSGFEDWLPTILNVVGAGDQVPAGVDGTDLSAVLEGQQADPRAFLYREFPGYGGQQMIRIGDWKLIRKNMRKGNLQCELYNLAQDPGETKDLASAEADTVLRLTEIMDREHVASELFPLAPLDTPQDEHGSPPDRGKAKTRRNN